MFVPCPHCGFLVALIVSRDAPSQRCPRCGKELHSEDDGSPASVAEDAPLASGDGEAATAAVSTGPAAPRRRREERTSTGKRRAPSFARRHAPSGGRVRWRDGLVAAVLLAVLAVQLLLAQRDDLAASPRWRPLASSVCAAMGCELPPWREPRAFTMLSRSVQPAPGRPHVLTVEASFRNDARWPQPWPMLWLGLSDVDAQVAAQRAFTAREYLGADADATRELAPGQSANVRFEITEPATQTVAFTFEFR